MADLGLHITLLPISRQALPSSAATCQNQLLVLQIGLCLFLYVFPVFELLSVLFCSVLLCLVRQRVNCCVARAQAGVLLRRLKFALPGWAQAERRRSEWREQAAQRAAQARAYSGEGHSEEWRFEFSRSYPQ